jgi:hypothetical protein
MFVLGELPFQHQVGELVLVFEKRIADALAVFWLEYRKRTSKERNIPGFEVNAYVLGEPSYKPLRLYEPLATPLLADVSGMRN